MRRWSANSNGGFAVERTLPYGPFEPIREASYLPSLGAKSRQNKGTPLFFTDRVDEVCHQNFVGVQPVDLEQLYENICTSLFSRRFETIRKE